MTVTRRALIAFAALALPLAALALTNPALAAPPADPAAFLHAIYRSIIADEGQTGGVDLFTEAKVRPKTFSASLVAVWAASDAKVQPGDMSEPDFDVFTESQDPQVKAYALTVKSASPTAAEIEVALRTRKADKKPYATLTFSLVAEAGGWRIDDIAGTGDGMPWTLRALLTLN